MPQEMDSLYSKRPKTRSPGRPRASVYGNSPDMASQILDIAKKLFMEGGFAAVSINAIVDKVGITKPTLYYYYADKETLFEAVLCDMMKAAGKHIEKGIQYCNTFEDTLLAIAKGFFRFAPTSMAVLFRDAASHLSADSLNRVNEVHQTFILEKITMAFTTAMQNGELVQGDANQFTQIALSLLDVLTIRMTMASGRHFEFEELAKVFVNLFLYGFSPSNYNANTLH
jgi:AcrR family transcriptional regulator